MRAAIINPYLDTLGGGERYSVGVANVLSSQGLLVDIEWPDVKIKKKLEERFGLSITKTNIVRKTNKGKGYDICFWVSDGSIPNMQAKNNWLHFQVPFTKVKGKKPINKIKLLKVKEIICNSKFTKNIIDKEYGVKSRVVYPPVDVEQFKEGKKTKTILFVGRFSQLKQSKRHDVLIDVFKKLYHDGFKDWKLVLVGGTDVGAGEYLEGLKQKSRGYPITFFESPKFEKVKKVYSAATFFWSAAGFGIDEKEDPASVEHFGIVAVEAMASGAIPLIYNAGGHKEIIDHNQDGILWNSIDDLVEETKNLIEDDKKRAKLIKNAKIKSNIFSYANFKKSIGALI